MSVRSRSNWNLEVLVFKERGKPENLEKNLSEQAENQQQTQLKKKKKNNNKLNSRMASTLGFEPRPHWWEANALPTAPSLLPKNITYKSNDKQQKWFCLK